MISAYWATGLGLNVWVFTLFSADELESPTSLLWTYYYLAQHFDHLQQFEKALSYINLALDHTMTLIELYMVKARIYKVYGGICEFYMFSGHINLEDE